MRKKVRVEEGERRNGFDRKRVVKIYDITLPVPLRPKKRKTPIGLMEKGKRGEGGLKVRGIRKKSTKGKRKPLR